MALADRLKALKPRGCIQRAVQLTKEQRRALNTEQKRQQRARDGQLVAPTQQFMAELARYDLPLVQLLMAEYALEATQAAALAARGGAAAGRHGARRLGEAAPHRAAAAQDCGRYRYMHKSRACAAAQRARVAALGVCIPGGGAGGCAASASAW